MLIVLSPKQRYAHDLDRLRNYLNAVIKDIMSDDDKLNALIEQVDQWCRHFYCEHPEAYPFEKLAKTFKHGEQHGYCPSCGNALWDWKKGSEEE